MKLTTSVEQSRRCTLHMLSHLWNGRARRDCAPRCRRAQGIHALRSVANRSVQEYQIFNDGHGLPPTRHPVSVMPDGGGGLQTSETGSCELILICYHPSSYHQNVNISVLERLVRIARRLNRLFIKILYKSVAFSRHSCIYNDRTQEGPLSLSVPVKFNV